MMMVLLLSSSYSGLLWLDVFARSMPCVTLTTHHFNRLRIIAGRRRWSLTAPLALPIRPYLAPLPSSTKHRVAISSTRRLLGRTTIVQVSRATRATTVEVILVTGLTRPRPKSRFRHATRLRPTLCSHTCAQLCDYSNKLHRRCHNHSLACWIA